MAACSRPATAFAAPVVLIGVVVLIVLRCPALLATRRFWAEEGSIYFAHAFAHGFWAGMAAPHLGYFNLVPNVATALATLVPLEQAPYVTTWAALLLQIAVSALVLYSTSPLLDTLTKRAIVAVGIQLLAPREVWLTTTCSQFWLCIAAFLILLEETGGFGAARRLVLRVVIGAAALTGMVSLFLFPLFFLKWLKRRVREDLVHTVILAGGGLVQGWAIVSALIGRDAHVGARFGGNDFSFWRVTAIHLVEPFFGTKIFESGLVTRMDGVFQVAAAVTLPPSILLAGGALVAVLTGASRAAIGERGLRPVLGAFFVVSLCSVLFSVRMASGPRYAFVPSVMILVLLVVLVAGKRSVWQRTLAGGLLGVLVAANLYQYREKVYYNPMLPSWPEEVSIWRQDPSYTPLIWPQFRSTSWSVKLEKLK